MVKIGNLELGSKPGVVAIIDDFVDVEQIINLKNEGVDMLEMRIDCFNASLEQIVTYLQSVRSAVSMPSIGTVRETPLNRSMRIDIFRSIAPFVDCVDIELGSPVSDDIKSCCSGKVILISEHDFEKTPSMDELNDMVKRACAQGADIVKLAVMTKDVADVRRLMRFTEECKVPLVTIGMGATGSVTRVIAPLFGSLFTYGYLKSPVAPGQLSVRKLTEEISLYFPGK